MAAEFTIQAAAEQLGIPSRTLRDWVKAGKVTTHAALPPARGVRISPEELERLRLVVAERVANSGEVRRDSEGRTAAGGEDPVRTAAGDGEVRQDAAAVELATLRTQLAAANTTIEAVTEERDFLRERLVESEKGEAELRVLLLNSQQALQAAEERLALPTEVPAPPAPGPDPEPPKREWWQAPPSTETPARPWWKFWGR